MKTHSHCLFTTIDSGIYSFYMELFLIYINDQPECVSSMFNLFANDCLVYRKIEFEWDIEILQNDLSNLELWVRKWLMNFNTDKCEVLQITMKPVTSNSYTLYGRHLKEVRN